MKDSDSNTMNTSNVIALASLVLAILAYQETKRHNQAIEAK